MCQRGTLWCQTFFGSCVEIRVNVNYLASPKYGEYLKEKVTSPEVRLPPDESWSLVTLKISFASSNH